MNDNFETRKKSIETQMVISYFIIGISFILFLAAPITAVSFLGGGIYSMILGKHFKKLSTDYKNTYIVDALKSVDENLEYKASMGIVEDDILNHRLLKKEDRFSSEDLISGHILGHRFVSSDVHQQDVRSTGKSTTVVTVFLGRVYKIKMNHSIESPVYIMPNHYNNLKFRDSLNKIDTESILFNNKFDIYAYQEHAAFYLVTPRMIEKILSVTSKVKRVMLSYQNDTLMLAFDTGIDAFDLKPFKPIDHSYVNEIKNEISLVKEIIEQLSK